MENSCVRHYFGIIVDYNLSSPRLVLDDFQRTAEAKNTIKTEK